MKQHTNNETYCFEKEQLLLLSRLFTAWIVEDDIQVITVHTLIVITIW